MMNFQDIKIKSKISDLMRCGGPWDGGYVVSKTALNACSRLYSYGIGFDSSFEKHSDQYEFDTDCYTPCKRLWKTHGPAQSTCPTWV